MTEDERKAIIKYDAWRKKRIWYRIGAFFLAFGTLFYWIFLRTYSVKELLIIIRDAIFVC